MSFPAVRDRLTRIRGWPRRLLAAALLLAAGLAETHALRHPSGPASPPTPPPLASVLAAARDLPAGTTLRADDLRAVELPPDAVPAHAIVSAAAALGRRVAGPVRRGEPLTDVRLVGPALTTRLGGPDALAVPLRLADSAAATLLRPGDRVDVLAVPASGGAGPPPAALASDVAVLSVVTDDSQSGVLLVVAAPEHLAYRLAATRPGALTVVLRPAGGPGAERRHRGDTWSE